MGGTETGRLVTLNVLFLITATIFNLLVPIIILCFLRAQTHTNPFAHASICDNFHLIWPRCVCVCIVRGMAEKKGGGISAR